jgi:hypothetical protein
MILDEFDRANLISPTSRGLSTEFIMTLSHEYFNRIELSSSQIDIWSKLAAVFAGELHLGLVYGTEWLEDV